MGTSFSVMYAVIFMIWLETPIVDSERFRLGSCTHLYKRFIDDLFVDWTGSVTKLCKFRTALASADDHIKLNWTGYESQREATDPIVAAREHGQVHSHMGRTGSECEKNEHHAQGDVPTISQAESLMQIQGKGSPLGLSLQLYHQRGIQCCQRRTVMHILHHLETAQGCECIWFTYQTHGGGNYATGPASQFPNC